ncbi:hypothetical protein [Streptomyces sp. NPDC056821]
MSKVELYAAIRRDHRGGMSMRELEPYARRDVADSAEGVGLGLAGAAQESRPATEPNFSSRS